MSNLIVSQGDLEKTGDQYHLNFRSGYRKGALRTDSNVLSDKWYVSYDFKLGNNWDWGSTGYDGNDRFLANVKCFRLWNPGSTNENIVITMQGWDNSFVFNVENIDDQVKYFFSGFKEKITKDKWHRFEFEFKENPAPGTPGGHFKMWFNGDVVLDQANLVTRHHDSGYKRPYIIGFDCVWSGQPDKAPNDFWMTNVVIRPDELRPVAPPPIPPVDPPIEPPVEPPVVPPVTGYPRQPEKINDKLVRLETPHGWVVYDPIGQASSVTYVPDINADWILEKETE